MKGADAVAKVLKTEGVEYLFCFPVNPIIDAVADFEIKPIMVRTERAAVAMADAYSRVTNGQRIGVVATQSGPGAENTFGGIAQAYSDSTPLLYLPMGMPQNSLASEPNFDAVKSYQYITKWAERVNAVQRIPEFMRRAYSFLRNGRPGPVLLEIPQNIMFADIDEASVEYEPPKGVRTMADPEAVREAVKAIIAAKKPVIHAGQGILYAQAWKELVEFAELVQVPVMTTLPGKSAFPEDHPLSLGSGGRSGPRAVARFLAEADLIFAAGSSITSTPFGAPVKPGKVAVQLTVDERDFNKDYKTAYPLMGDAKLVLRQMIEEAQKQLGAQGRKGDDTVAREVKAVKDEWLSEWMPKLTSDSTPINPYRVVWEAQQVFDVRNTIATHDAGSPRDQMSPFWPALEPNSYIGWGKSTHLGYGLPLAMGAKLARPDKTVFNLMGDAAFGMSGLDIETAARNNIGIVTILMNNSRLGGYDKHLPRATQRYGTRFITGDYTKIAEGLGAHSEKVEKADELAPAIKRAIKVAAEGRPAFLEVITLEEHDFSVYW